MFSEIALKIYSMKKTGIIKSNAHFWKEFNNVKKIETFDIDTNKDREYLANTNFSLVCVFDKDFINIPQNIKNSDKPFLFVYQGNVTLLNQIQNNVAVVGVLNPTKEIVERECEIVKELCNNHLAIISGLALGCDCIAHKTCLTQKGKTIAILPTTLEKIYPQKNISIINEILSNNGLVLTEYINEPANKFERIKRFVERDRLQAMLSKAVVMIASYEQGKGDSGSRHAMQKAKEYGRRRFVMFNKLTDKGKDIFELNKKMIDDGAMIISQKAIKELFFHNATDC